VTARVLVVGVGRLDRGDDAAGRLAVRRLRGRVGAGVDLVEVDGEMTGLLEAWQGAGVVIVVDAVRGGAPPGTLVRLDATREPLPATAADSSHGLGLAEAIGLARTLGRLPRRLIVHGIEGARFEAGAALSPEVAAGLDALAEQVMKEAEARL
jgi:hydrogenase maturation protease